MAPGVWWEIAGLPGQAQREKKLQHKHCLVYRSTNKTIPLVQESFVKLFNFHETNIWIEFSHFWILKSFWNFWTHRLKI